MAKGLSDNEKKDLTEYNQLMQELGKAQLKSYEAEKQRSQLLESNLQFLRKEVEAKNKLAADERKDIQDLQSLTDKINAARKTGVGLVRGQGIATEQELRATGKNLAALQKSLSIKEKDLSTKLKGVVAESQQAKLLEKELKTVKDLEKARQGQLKILDAQTQKAKDLKAFESKKSTKLADAFGLYDGKAAVKDIKGGGTGTTGAGGAAGKMAGKAILGALGLGGLGGLIGNIGKGGGGAGGGGGAAGGGVAAAGGGGGSSIGGAIDAAAQTGNPYAIGAKIIKDVGGKMLDIFKPVDTDAGNLARTLNTTYEAALQARTGMAQLASAQESVFVTGKNMAQTTIEMNNELGTAVNFDAQRLTQQTMLRNAMKNTVGDTAQAKSLAADILKTSIATGVSDFEIYKNRLAQIRLVKAQKNLNIDERSVLMDISKVSNNIKLNYLGQDQALTRAAASARALGTNLTDIDKTAESLTNFETSIAAQMEAELLTGKTMNLERMRFFALTNDLVGMTSELNAQGITALSYGKMNRIQQEAYAKSLGMSKEDMSAMLMEQQLIGKLGTKDLETAKEKYRQAVLEGKEKQFIAGLGDDALATQFKQMSIQDRNMAVQEKMALALEVIAERMTGRAFSAIVRGKELAAEGVNAPQGAFAEEKRGNTSYMGASDKALPKKDERGFFERTFFDKGKETPKLAEGGLVKQGGNAVVDSGEVFLGKNSIGTLNMMVTEMKAQNMQLAEQNKYLQVIASKNTSVSMDGRVVSDMIGQNATVSYGNLLNPASSTYR